MIQRLAAYTHHRRGHTQSYLRTIGFIATGTRGIQIKCQCGKKWTW